MTIDPFATIAGIIPSFEEEDDAALTEILRAMSLEDPMRGDTMAVELPTGVKDDVLPGQWRHGYVTYRTGLPINCPVTPLGKLGNVTGTLYFFLDTLGEVVALGENAGKGNIASLFSGRPKYLEWAWPRLAAPKRKGDPWTVKGWEADEARNDLFAACAYMGTFDIEDQVRGRGAWRDDNGALILHAGDAVWIDGKWKPPGSHGRFIYPGRPKIGRPSRDFQPQGEGSPGDVLLQGLRSWTWERPELDPRLALGWVMTAMVGGALEQRPVAYVVGTEGAGKSTLQKLFRLLMNGALLATSNTTQAGIYQKVKQDSVAVLVDEMEAKEDTRTTDKILELARVAYSGDKMQRGGKDGVGQEFSVNSSFLMSSIAMPPVDAQDASRMAVLMLRERVMTPGAADVLKTLGLRDAKKVQEIGRQLLRRMVQWMTMEGNRTKWDGLIEAFKAALAQAGHSDRSADTFGTLAAACHAAMRDTMPDESELKEWKALLNAATLEETSGREKTWRRCFMQIMDAQPDGLRNLSKKSAGEALMAFRDNKFGVDDVNNVLKVCGLSLSWPKDTFGEAWQDARLFIPAKHPALNILLAHTPWAGRMGAPGPWLGVLRQMPKHLWQAGKCGKGLDDKASGIFISLAAALEHDDAPPMAMAA